jgi:hypothetical protein
MATTNVKILLRRGLREEIGVNTLDTGEMGFAIDTNQLFIGIDDAIDEVQFDVFANAHAVIQTWLDSTDNPYQANGLRIDEDLVIRDIPDVDVLINAMHFYVQNVEWQGQVSFAPGEIIYLKEFTYDTHRIPSSEIDKDKTYIIKTIGNTDYVPIGAAENKANVKFTATGLGPLLGDGTVLEVIGTEDYTQASIVSTSYDGLTDITSTTMYVRHNAVMPAQDIAPNNNPTDMIKSHFGLFKWSGTGLEWVSETIDNVYDHQPVNPSLDYTGAILKPSDAVGILDAIAVVVGVSTVTYWKRTAITWVQLGAGTEDFRFHTTDIDNMDISDSPIPVPVLRSNGDPLVDGDYYIDYSRDLQNGLSLILSEFNSLTPRLASIPPGIDLGDLTLEEINTYYSYEDTVLPTFVNEVHAVQDMLDYQLVWALPDFTSGVATITMREKDQAGSSDFTDYDYNNTHRSYYYTKSLIGAPDDTDFADTTYVQYIEIPEFEAPFYARSRRNVEVVTENSFNSLFADQHLSSYSHHTGKRSSLFRKLFEIQSGLFLRYHVDSCTTFFVDYSLIQRGSGKVFVRAGQIKVINGYPHNIQQVKLTDESTEIWQDFNADNIAEMYPNPLYPTPPAVPAPPVAPEVEFSNIQFDVKLEDTVLVTSTTKALVDAWMLTSANTTVGGYATQQGDDVVVRHLDPNWDFTTFIADITGGSFTAAAAKGTDLQVFFNQDATYNVEISYTVKRWSM